MKLEWSGERNPTGVGGCPAPSSLPGGLGSHAGAQAHPASATAPGTHSALGPQREERAWTGPAHPPELPGDKLRPGRLSQGQTAA